jgi:Tfp pilus assembly major pilin PilA
VLIIVIIFIMVVVLGILAAIAIPAYQDYLARATAGGM